MRETALFLRVFLKRPVIWVAFAVTLLVTLFSFTTSKLTDQLPCALYSCDDSKEAKEVVSYLGSKDFVLCGTEKEVYELVRSGLADTGVILNEGFAEKLTKDDLRDCARLITSERSIQTSTYKLMAAVAIYQQVMPYKAAATAEEMGFSVGAEDILFYSETVRSMVNPLEFPVVTVDGKSTENLINHDLQAGVIAIACFVMLGMICIAMIRNHSSVVRPRFSSRTGYFSKCLLPQCAAAGTILFVSTAAGILVSTLFSEVPVAKFLLALLLYLAVLVVFFAAVSLLPIPSMLLICLIAIDAAVSLILCPLYGGTNLLIRYIGPLRALSVPYLFYLFLF